MLASDDVELSSAARERIDAAYKMVDAADQEAQPLKHALQRFGTRQPACRALVDAQYGIGGLLAVVLWTELGDCRRFSRSEQAVRHSGLDVTVDSSDRRRAGGHLSRQGPETLRWALYEAAKNSSHGEISRQPLLRQGQGATRREDRRDLGRTSARAPQLSRAAGDRARSRLRHPGLSDVFSGSDGACRPHKHQGLEQSAPATGVPASVRAGRPSNTDATAPPIGGHPITIVVADRLRPVEHLGNAGRPHAVPGRIITQRSRLPGRGVARALTRALHTGNAG